MGNKSLQAAMAARDDEFYTQRTDIENELRHYKSHFKNKVVYCNCDDPLVSEFVKFFMRSFNHLGLKRLIATCYKHNDINLFGAECTQRQYGASNESVYFIFEGGNYDIENIEVHRLEGNGDFRSKECVELLKQADIVCTNPPFSIFGDYIAQLVSYDKKFLIIGNQNALHYSDVFRLVKENKVWPGYTSPKIFATPLKEIDNPKIQFVKNDIVFQKFGNIIWFTNLDIEKRHSDLPLYKRYDANFYPHYYNYDAIDVGRVEWIPEDYYGKMGVPDSFLLNYNPDQFEIVGLGRDGEGITVDRSIYPKIKKLNPNSRPSHIGYYDKDGTPKEPFSRIIIKRK